MMKGIFYLKTRLAHGMVLIEYVTFNKYYNTELQYPTSDSSHKNCLQTSEINAVQVTPPLSMVSDIASGR